MDHKCLSCGRFDHIIINCPLYSIENFRNNKKIKFLSNLQNERKFKHRKLKKKKNTLSINKKLNSIVEMLQKGIKPKQKAVWNLIGFNFK